MENNYFLKSYNLIKLSSIILGNSNSSYYLSICYFKYKFVKNIRDSYIINGF